MIRRCSGTIVSVRDNFVHVALSSLPALVMEISVPQVHDPGLAIGQEATLYTYLHVRPEELSLFGVSV